MSFNYGYLLCIKRRVSGGDKCGFECITSECIQVSMELQMGCVLILG